MRGRGRRVHRRRAVPSAAHRVRGAVLRSCSARGLPPRPLPPRPAPLLRPRAASAYTRTAFLPLRRPRVRRAPAPDLRALLRFLRAWPGATFLPRALRRLRAQPDLQVSCATTASNPDGCFQDQAPSCLRAYAGLVGMHRPEGISRGCLRLDGPITLFSGFDQAQPSRPTTWTTQARAWSPGATAEPAEIGVRSAKSSGGSLRGTAAWTVPYRPLTVGGPQSYVTSWTPTRTLGRVSCRSTLCSHLPRCLLQMCPWRGAPCSPCFLFWLSSPCSDLDSRPWTTVPPCLGYWASLVAYCPTEKGLACLLSWPTALCRSGHCLSCSKVYI
ncbi:GDNF family receptor alpha-4 isoform X1 [Ovis canadensis]|uniref:GDNF family receptor alpha-4 isoform X1 n=1 Tax=Ovis canadensis TaxID=37174 RepID=UPI00375262A2